MNYANFKSTPLCYTRELIDALVELDLAFKAVNTEPIEVKYFNALKIDLDKASHLFQADDAVLQAFFKKVNDRGAQIQAAEAAKRANLESKKETVIGILKKLLVGKLVVPGGCKYHEYIISVNDIHPSERDKYSIMAAGEMLNLFPFKDNGIHYPNEVAIWYNDYSILSVAQRVADQLKTGTIPVTDKGMICTVDPNDALNWLETRKTAFETEHHCKTEWIKSHKQVSEPESLKENE